MKISLKIAVLTLLLYSCSCNYHIKKVKAKCGYSSDTVYRVDTMFTKEVSTDTVFKYYTKDTVVIKEGKLTVKYFYNTHDSTVFLQGKCDADTVYKKVPFIVNKYRESWVKQFGWLFRWVVLFFVLYVIFRVLKKTFQF